MKKLILLFSLSLIAFSCAKKESNTATTQTSQYVYQNGACYDQTNQRYADPALCSNALNSGFTYVNGVCTQTTTGAQSPPGYCQNNGVGGAQQCYGQYIYNQNGNYQQVQCAGANCRGYTLISQTTGQQVVCQ
jgi:hypothetical protein